LFAFCLFSAVVIVKGFCSKTSF